MSSDIFLSYGSADRDVARELAKFLQDNGRSVWWDRQITPGDDFELAIEKAISESACVLVIWSERSAESNWVRAEAIEGLERKILLPVVISDVRLPLSFRSINRVDLSGWPETHNPQEIDRLLQRVADLLDGNATQEPAPLVSEASSGKAEIPAVAVMPLRTLSENSDDELLSAGISNEVISSLSRMPSFFVIAFSTMWSLRNQDMTARDIASQLGVRYVVQGTLMRVGHELQIMAEAIDGKTNQQLWSESFRTPYTVDQVFNIQDKMATAITGRIQPRLMVAETQRSMIRSPEHLEAWELVNRARQRHVSRDKNQEVLRLLERAIHLDPDYGEAHAMLAMILSFRASVRGPQYAGQARAAIDKALQVAPDHDLTLMAAGVACVNIAEYKEALFYCNRAVELNPNFAQAWAYLGLSTLGAHKDGETALKHLDRAFELSPRDEDLYNWYHLKAPCYAQLDNYEMAAEMTAKSVHLYRDWFFSWMCHAQYLAVTGDLDAAERAWEEARIRFPKLDKNLYNLSVRHYSPVSETHKEKLIAAVGKLKVH